MRAAASVTLLALTAGLGLLPGAAFAQQGSQDEQILQQKSGTETPPPVEQQDEEELSTTYSSIGLQKVHLKIDGVDTKDPVNLDITLIGFRIPTVPWFGVELNLGFTMIPGQYTTYSGGAPGTPVGCGPLGTDPCPATPGSPDPSQDLAATTAAAWGVFRSTGKFFAMGKLGYRYISTNLTHYPDTRTGSAWGGGIGYRWNRKGSYAEFGYTKYTSDIDALGFTVSYSYGQRNY